MKIDYVIADPTGNITILVTSPVPEELQARCASRLMALFHESQQVGYLSFDNGPRLRMMGGEFCGNASMSCGAYMARRLRVDRLLLTLEVSGAKEPVEVEIDGDSGKVRMPLPERVYTDTFDGRRAAVVEFQGITHILTDSFDIGEAEKRISEWNKKIGADALGVMVIDEEAKSLTPVVYVPSTGTIVRESSCASGTAAAGAYFCLRENKSASFIFSEPAGEMGISGTVENGKLAGLILSGHVRISETGSVEIALR